MDGRWPGSAVRDRQLQGSRIGSGERRSRDAQPPHEMQKSPTAGTVADTLAGQPPVTKQKSEFHAAMPGIRHR